MSARNLERTDIPGRIQTAWRPAVRWMLCLVLVLTTLAPAFGDETHDEILRAAQNPLLSTTPRDQALVLKHINEIHLLRGMGRLTDPQYQNLMFWHQSQNLLIARQAIERLGVYKLDVQKVASDAGAWRTGSDTDFLVSRTDGKPVTLEDIQAIERAYRIATNEQIRRLGRGEIKPPSQRYDTSTDFMVAHDATTPEEFARIGTHFENKQADTYKRIEAARVEAQMRTPGAEIDLLDGGHYVNEMVDQATRKQARIDALRRERASADPEQRARIDAQIRQLEYERNKYIKRVNALNTHLAGSQTSNVEGMQDLARQAKLAYLRTLNHMLVGLPEGTKARQASFVLALHIHDLPPALRQAQIAGLDPSVQSRVLEQLKQFEQLRRAERERVSKQEVVKLEGFLSQTELGQRLIKVFGAEIEALTTRPTESSRFIADLYRDLSAVDQKIQNRAQSLAMWLDVVTQIRKAKSDADLAIALGRTLASKTYYGLIASYAYTGLVERDPTALAKSLIILLCPKAALPQVVQAIGGSVIELTTSTVFDHQFMVLYVSADFDKDDGHLLGLKDFHDGPDAVCRFVHETLQPGGEHWVEGLFTRALDLAKERNLSQEVLSGLNAFGKHAFVQALESTIYGGSASFMADNASVQQARAEVAAVTQLIDDFAEGLGIEVPLTADTSWPGLSALEPAAQQAFRKLFELRSQTWSKTEQTLCAAIKESLERRHRAEMALAGGDAAALALLEQVEALLHALDIHELGLSWLNYEGTYNLVMRTLVISNQEQRIKAMETLQRYHTGYSAVQEIRRIIESLIVTSADSRLSPRPLTGAPPLTGDPEFDHALAARTLERLTEDLAGYEKRLLWTKRNGVNDWLANLDDDFDRQTLEQITVALIDYHNASATMQGASHIQTRVNKVLEFGKSTLAHLKHREAFGRTERLRSTIEDLITRFEERYRIREPELSILPPPAIVEGRATTDELYVFGLASQHLPPAGATYVWREDGHEIGRGERLLYAFDAAGRKTLSIDVAWSKSDRVIREGKVSAKLVVDILQTAKKPGLTIDAPEDLSSSGASGRSYVLRAAAIDIPADAEFIWLIDGVESGQGKQFVLNADRPGSRAIELVARWKVAGSSTGVETIWAPPLIARIVEDADKTDDPKPTGTTEQKPACSYAYSAWSDCNRATKTQTRTVTAREPAGCEERQKPSLEQSCTPPPTEEELRHRYFNCLCRCSSGWAGHIGVWYDPEGKSIPECESSGPCFGGAGAFGCTRRHFFAGPSDCAKGCWEGSWGKGAYDPAKADALRKGENRKYKKPLTVQIEASKNPADFGDIVDLTAKTSEGSGGYSWSWSGCAEDAAKDRAKVPFTQSCRPCTANVTVTDQDGDTASDSLPVQCTALSVKLTKERPAENTIPVGDKAGLLAEVFSGDQPAGGRFTYYWEPNPDVQYGGDPKNPSYETSGGAQSRNTALFRQTGRTPVWVTVLKQVGETKVTVGESEQILIDVISPQLSLKADKTSPLIGETVVLTVEETPKMSDDLVSFWWEYSGEASNPGVHPNTPNSRAWSYKPKNDKPVTITVHAKSKDSGEELDSASLTLTARRIQVSVSGPRIAGPAPMVWKPGVGLVAAERQVAEHQRVEFSATLNPSIDNPRYQWRIEPSGCSIHSPSARDTGVTCSSTGSYSLSVTVKNADGAELGSGAGQLSVSVSQAAVDSGRKTAKAIEETLAQAREQAGRGRLDEALSLAKQALALDPAYAPTKQYVASVEKAKAGLDRDLAAIEQLIGQGKLDAARSRLDTRAKAFPEYPPLVVLQERLKQASKSTGEKGVKTATATGVWEVVANGWPGRLELGANCTRLRIERGWEALASVSVADGVLNFTRPLGAVTQVYRGTLSADVVQGTFTQGGAPRTYDWSGKRLAGETPCSDDTTPDPESKPESGPTSGPAKPTDNSGTMSGWSVDSDVVESTAGEISTSPPSDGVTSYYRAPASLLGDWSGFSRLSFDKKSSGGRSYASPDEYGADGDVVIESPHGTARFDIEPDHSGNWRTYRIPLSGDGWKLGGGARSLAEVLTNVTGLRIRAEYGVGKDESALRAVRLDGQAAATSPPSGTQTATTSAVSSTETRIPAEPVVSFDNGNIYGVGNGPTSTTTFELEEPRILAMIQNYHWNSARGATPGTIALRDAQGRQYGPWQTEGSPGQGGVPNAYWTARPMIRLPAGVYTVIDSDPASWAQNAQSDGRGFTRVETLPASGGVNP